MWLFLDGWMRAFAVNLRKEGSEQMSAAAIGDCRGGRWDEIFTLDLTFGLIAIGALAGAGVSLIGAPLWASVVVAAAVHLRGSCSSDRSPASPTSHAQGGPNRSRRIAGGRRLCVDGNHRTRWPDEVAR